MTRLLLAAIALYQRLLSPLLGPTCRFHPSCSTYTAICIDRLGPARGVLWGARRIARCHPFHPGGVDLPPAGRTALGAEPSPRAHGIRAERAPLEP